MLNKQKGNMYGFVTHTWNPIKGKCSHDCSYCYMKVFPQGKLRLDKKSLKDNLGKGNYLFVGSSTDMFAEKVPNEWIKEVLNYCNKFDNQYLFQSKNPIKFWKFISIFPKKTVLCTTVESNRDYDFSGGMTISERLEYIQNNSFKIMVTIEPILDFDFKKFVNMLYEVKPNWVNIGADSKGHNLPEPSYEKVYRLIKALKEFTNVNLKPNLNRLVK